MLSSLKGTAQKEKGRRHGWSPGYRGKKTARATALGNLGKGETHCSEEVYTAWAGRGTQTHT